jgi:hypothetical protein
MNVKNWSDYSVGDSVYCLAWVGKKFEIVSKDDEILSLQGESEFDPYGAQIDLIPKLIWMVTKEPWDQIWYWPDRAGESYEQVFKRFAASHKPGEIIGGYFFEPSPLSADVDKAPEKSMAFRIVAIDNIQNEIQVEPVVGLSADGTAITDPADVRTAQKWIKAGPVVPATISMRAYRWSVSVGPIVLNWPDFGGESAW